MTLAQLAAPLAPPAGSPAGLLGWVVAILMGGAIILWRLRENERKERIAALEARLTDRDSTIKGLGEKLDRERDDWQHKIESANAKAENVALLMMRQLTIEQIRSFDDPRENTTVTRAVTMAQAAIVDPMPHLKGWDPNESTPPGSQSPRRKLPSRS